MKTNPLEVRRALARLPGWTQAFWTWLTGVALPGTQPRWPWSMRTHLLALLLAWLVTLCLGVGSVAWLLDMLLGA